MNSKTTKDNKNVIKYEKMIDVTNIEDNMLNVKNNMEQKTSYVRNAESIFLNKQDYKFMGASLWYRVF